MVSGNNKKDQAAEDRMTAVVENALERLFASGTLGTADDCRDAEEALRILQERIRESTAAMSSVPLPLKIMRPRFQELVDLFESGNPENPSEGSRATRRLFADLLSVLSTIFASKEAKLSFLANVKPAVDALNEEALKPKADPVKDMGERSPEDEAEPKTIEEMMEELDNGDADGEREAGQHCTTLKYRLLGSGVDNLSDYGREYVRSLHVHVLHDYYASKEHRESEDAAVVVENCTFLGLGIARILCLESAWLEGVDLLCELGKAGECVAIAEEFSEGFFPKSRVAEYLAATGDLERSCEDAMKCFEAAKEIYMLQDSTAVEAFNLIIWMEARSKIGFDEFVVESFELFKKFAGNGPVLKQLAFTICNADVPRYTDEQVADIVSFGGDDETLRNQIHSILCSRYVAEHWDHVVSELEITESIHPDDIYKNYLETSYRGLRVYAARNRADSYVSGFVNCGLKRDPIVSMEDKEGRNWPAQNKLTGRAAAVVAHAALYLFDLEGGIAAIDYNFYGAEGDAPDPTDSGYHKGGALLSYGLLAARNPDDYNLGIELVYPFLGDPSHADFDPFVLRCGLHSLSIALCGKIFQTRVIETMPGIIESAVRTNYADPTPNVEIGAVALGLISCGSGDGEVTENILQLIMEMATMSEQPLDTSPGAPMIALGLGLNFLGNKDYAICLGMIDDMETTMNFRRMLKVVLQACGNAGSHDMDMLGYFLRVVSDGADVDEKDRFETPNTDTEVDDKFERAESRNSSNDRKLAVIALALLSLGDPIGRDLLLKMADTLMTHGDQQVMRALSLALALAYASDPVGKVIDYITKLCYEVDSTTALTSMLALGIVCAGTNNARAARTLRQLAQSYGKSANGRFLVNVAQGLVHLGQGLLTLSPMSSRGRRIHKKTLAHLLVVLTSAMNTERYFLSEENHMFLWHLVAAARSKHVLMLDEETLQQSPVTLRLGTSINTLGMAGKPRPVAGFQTHSSPVLIGQGEQAEIDHCADATLSITTRTEMLEDVVLVKKTTLTPITQTK